MEAAPLLNFNPTAVADRMFYKSFLQIKQGCLMKSVYLFIQTLVLGGLIIYLNLENDVQTEVDPQINNAIVIMIVACLYGLLIKVLHLKVIYSRPAIYLAIAQVTNHLVLSENIKSLENI